MENIKKMIQDMNYIYDFKKINESYLFNKYIYLNNNEYDMKELKNDFIYYLLKNKLINKITLLKSNKYKLSYYLDSNDYLEWKYDSEIESLYDYVDINFNYLNEKYNSMEDDGFFIFEDNFVRKDYDYYHLYKLEFEGEYLFIPYHLMFSSLLDGYNILEEEMDESYSSNNRREIIFISQIDEKIEQEQYYLSLNKNLLEDEFDTLKECNLFDEIKEIKELIKSSEDEINKLENLKNETIKEFFEIYNLISSYIK